MKLPISEALLVACVVGCVLAYNAHPVTLAILKENPLLTIAIVVGVIAILLIVELYVSVRESKRQQLDRERIADWKGE